MARPGSNSTMDGEALLPIINAYCKLAGISTRQFGVRCMHDSDFVRSLSHGRLLRQETAEKVKQWIAKRKEVAAKREADALSEETLNSAKRKDGPPQGFTSRELAFEDEVQAASLELRERCISIFERHARRIGTDMPTAGARLLQGIGA